MIYIFDIDGTLADCTHRLGFINEKPANWVGFFAACVNDEPIPEIIQVAKSLAGCAKIVMVRGRSDVVRNQTLDWMSELSIPCDCLMMREAGDHREDSIVKAELLDDLRETFPDEQIAGVFEDRKQVVDMSRAKGLRVFQVAEGNF